MKWHETIYNPSWHRDVLHRPIQYWCDVMTSIVVVTSITDDVIKLYTNFVTKFASKHNLVIRTWEWWISPRSHLTHLAIWNEFCRCRSLDCLFQGSVSNRWNMRIWGMNQHTGARLILAWSGKYQGNVTCLLDRWHYWRLLFTSIWPASVNIRNIRSCHIWEYLSHMASFQH